MPKTFRKHITIWALLLIVVFAALTPLLGPLGLGVRKKDVFVDVAFGPDTSIVDLVIKKKNNYDEVRAALDAQPSLVTHFFFNGLSLLHHAVGWDRMDLIPMLIEKGADINTSTQGRPANIDASALFETPIYLAGNVEMMQLLLKYGADPNVKCRYYNSLLEALEANHKNDLAATLRKAIDSKPTTKSLPLRDLSR